MTHRAAVSPPPASTASLVAISNAMVRIHKRHVGRGPTKARASFLNPDVLVCTLEDSPTTAGEHERLRDLRHYLQHARAKELIRAVEQISGCTVRAFTSGMDTHQNVTTETFYLESSSPSPCSERRGYG